MPDHDRPDGARGMPGRGPSRPGHVDAAATQPAVKPPGAAWYLFAGAGLSLIAGDAAHDLLGLILPGSDPLPWVARLCRVLACILLATGMLLVVRARSSTRDRASVPDADVRPAAQVAAAPSASLAADPGVAAGDERLRRILQTTSDIVVIVDSHGEIVFGTPSLEGNLGLAPADVLGRRLAEFLDEADAA